MTQVYSKLLPKQPSLILPCTLRSVLATISSAAGSTSPTIPSAPGFLRTTSASPPASTRTTLATHCSRLCTKLVTPCMSKPLALRSTARRSAKVSRLASMKASHGFGRTWWGAAAVSGSIFYPRLQRIFAEQLSGVPLAVFHRAINKVARSLIRTDADELTYNLHITLRFDLELKM